jgi:hypothetical protein
MTTVLLNGRKLPHGDWEGDDFTPGAGGKYVTCTDSALGRDIYWATNGRADIDGRQVRKAVQPPDPDGLNLMQVKQAAKSLGYTFVTPLTWQWADVLAHLKAQKGLVMQLWYGKIPRQYRFQASAEFGHATWASHFSATSGIRNWDPLDANEAHHGSWVPAIYIRAAVEEWARRVGSNHLLVGYVPLQPL